MLNFKDMKIFTQLIGAFSVVAVVLAIVGAVGWYGIKTLELSLNEVAEVRLPSIKGLGLMMEEMNGIKAGERTILSSSISAKDRQLEIDNIKKRWQEFERGFSIYTPLPKTREEAALWEEFLRQHAKMKVEHKKLEDQVARVTIGEIEKVKAVMFSRKLDHANWVADLDRQITNRQLFTGQLDPSLCRLGKWMATYRSNDPSFNALLDKFTEPHNHLHRLGGEINNLVAAGRYNEARQRFNNEVRPVLAQIDGIFNAALEELKSFNTYLQAATDTAFGSGRQTFESAMAAIDKVFELNSELAETATIEGERRAERSKITALVSVLFGVIAAMFFGYFIAASIATPMGNSAKMLSEMGRGHLGMRLKMDRKDEIGQMAKTMDDFADNLQNEVVGSLQKLANGDLTFDVTAKDDKDVIGTALIKTRADLSGMVTEILAATEQIAADSGQVAESSQSLSQGATESAASLEQITSSMTEIASQTNTNAENAGQANQLANQARDTAETGNTQMQDMVGAMAEINVAGQNISKIIKVIDEIAFQTNLLALNAAVEAARAGKHGKGFAVVAEEVRNLAARSAKAAKETAELIEGSVQKTGAGTKIANQTAESLAAIVSSVAKVTDLVGEISASSNEQAEGISQITQGLNQIDQVTQANTASAEKGAAAAEKLSSQSAHLKELMATFRIKGNSSNSMIHRHLPAPALSTSEFQEWGEDMNRGPAGPKPGEVIALDDKEFGRY